MSELRISQVLCPSIFGCRTLPWHEQCRRQLLTRDFLKVLLFKAASVLCRKEFIAFFKIECPSVYRSFMFSVLILPTLGNGELSGMSGKFTKDY